MASIQARDVEWISAIGADRPPKVRFGYVGAGQGEHVEGRVPNLRYRDLGGSAATDGKAGNYEIVPAPGATATDWIADDLDFHSMFVVEGSLRVETPDGGKIELNRLDMIHLPVLSRYRLEMSADLKVVELRIPAAGPVIVGEATPLPARATDLDADRAPYVNHDAPEKYLLGAGPRTFFEYRDLGGTKETAGRVRLEILRTHAGGGSAGWHYHTMGQFVYVYRGKALIEHKDVGVDELVPGSAMTIGDHHPHNLWELTDDYELLETYFPAEWDTIPCAKPEGAVSG